MMTMTTIRQEQWPENGAQQVTKKYGWKPEVALKDGLASMVEDFKARLSVTIPDQEALVDNVLAN